MKETYKSISSLSEFIKEIERQKLFDCISRGEHKLYNTPLTSSILRENNKDSYSKLLETYHHEISHRINDLQNINFVAFSQHHGIPTNLLDFSFSPLTSLYFATEKANNKAYVYFIKKSKLVDVGKSITNRPFGYGMIDDILDFNSELLKEIIPSLSNAFSNNLLEMIEFFDNKLKNYVDIFEKRYLCYSDLLPELKNMYNHYLEIKSEWQKEYPNEKRLLMYDSFNLLCSNLISSMKNSSFSFKNEREALSKNVFSSYEYSLDVFLLLLIIKLNEIQMLDTTKENTIEMPFYFSYQPPIIDIRVQNQSSVFVFQPFGTGSIRKSFYPLHPIQIWQKIIPDYTLEIEHPKRIYNELCKIGFNPIHIYNDFDSISKYITNQIL